MRGIAAISSRVSHGTNQPCRNNPPHGAERTGGTARHGYPSLYDDDGALLPPWRWHRHCTAVTVTTVATAIAIVQIAIGGATDGARMAADNNTVPPTLLPQRRTLAPDALLHDDDGALPPLWRWDCRCSNHHCHRHCHCGRNQGDCIRAWETIHECLQ
jgi:hypothetical protein